MTARHALELARVALTGGDEFVSAEDAVAAIDQVLRPEGQVLYELPYPPSANNYWRTRVIQKGKDKWGKPRYLPIVYTTDEARDYKKQVALLGKVNGWRPFDGDVSIKIDVWRPRKIGDLDGPLKVGLDALNGVAWTDDKQVVHLEATRHDDKENPRAEITVVPA